MALKKKISKDDYNALPEYLKSEYSESNGNYVLDIDGEEDVGALKRAKDRESQLRREAEKELKDAREKLEALDSNDARKKGDIETLEKSWAKKHSESEAQYNARIQKLTDYTTKTMLDGAANAIASKISTVPTLMAKVVRERLTVDFEGDEPVLKILDASGKPSNLTIEQLSNEFVANKDFASIIVGSKASGSGTSKNGFDQRNGSATQTNPEKPVSLATLTPQQLAEHIKANSNAN